MFKIYKHTFQEKVLTFKEFVFPAGEVSVKLNARDYGFKESNDIPTILARIQSSDDVMKLAMLRDALGRFNPGPVDLVLPYMPYARQDRVCDAGESASLRVMASMINAMNFNKVTVIDPHSIVTEALLNNVEVVSQLAVLNRWLDFHTVCRGALIVSPDAGSNKKAAEAAKYFSHQTFIRADKLRDLTTGAIIETIVYCDDLGGRDVVILDDICERGGTFLLLADALKKKNCGKIFLYVTHGVFGGVQDLHVTMAKLLNGGIDQIWTTNSYHADIQETEKLKVFNIEKALPYEA